MGQEVLGDDGRGGAAHGETRFGEGFIVRECITHHCACDCREKHFAELECELRRLKKFLHDIQDQAILIKTDYGYRFVVPQQFMSERCD